MNHATRIISTQNSNTASMNRVEVKREKSKRIRTHTHTPITFLECPVVFDHACNATSITLQVAVHLKTTCKLQANPTTKSTYRRPPSRTKAKSAKAMNQCRTDSKHDAKICPTWNGNMDPKHTPPPIQTKGAQRHPNVDQKSPKHNPNKHP